MKKQFWVFLVALLTMLIPGHVMAQEIIEIVDSVSEDEMIVDTVSVDELMSKKPKITQYDLKECEWVDICYNPRYAIVTKDGKQGIYDMMLHQNVTEIEFREIGYSRAGEPVDSIQSDWFYARKGIKRGIVCVFENDNSIMSIWMDDPDEVYSLDECTTIDKKLTKWTKKLLEGFMQQQQMDNAQLVVLDAKTGRLKTWIRLDRDIELEEAGKLLVHSCAGSLTKPFHTIMALENDSLSLDCTCNGVSYRQAIRNCNNQLMQQAILNGYRRNVAERKWKALTDTGNPSTSPFIMAVGYNSLANNGTMIIPTMKADSVSVEENVFTDSNLAKMREVLKVDRIESPQLAWLANDSEWFGYATTEYIYAESDKERLDPIGKQIQFAGLFPVENPRYTICLVADKQSLEVTPAIFQDIVNPLSKWLLKR